VGTGLSVDDLFRLPPKQLINRKASPHLVGTTSKILLPPKQLINRKASPHLVYFRGCTYKVGTGLSVDELFKR
jgi:hypothetical protein